MGKLITFKDGRKVSEVDVPDPPAPDVDAEIAELKARLAALEDRAQGR